MGEWGGERVLLLVRVLLIHPKVQEMASNVMGRLAQWVVLRQFYGKV
jgi:hypothetical protein